MPNQAPDEATKAETTLAADLLEALELMVGDSSRHDVISGNPSSWSEPFMCEHPLTISRL